MVVVGMRVNMGAHGSKTFIYAVRVRGLTANEDRLAYVYMRENVNLGWMACSVEMTWWLLWNGWDVEKRRNSSDVVTLVANLTFVSGHD